MVLEKTWGSATKQRSEVTHGEALTGDIRSFYSPSRYTVMRPPLGGCVRSICSCSNNGLEKWWRIFPGDHRTCGTGGRCYLTGKKCHSCENPISGASSTSNWMILEAEPWGGTAMNSNFPDFDFGFQTERPASTTHRSHTKPPMEEMGAGSQRLWKRWRRVWTSGKKWQPSSK